MIHSEEELKQAVSDFIQSCGRDYEFPAGGRIELFTSHEQVLLRLLSKQALTIEDRIRLLANGRDWSDCYSIVVLAIRLAIHSVRRNDAEVYRIGVIALTASCPRVDWRDVLRAFSVFEFCGNQIGVDFRSEIEPLIRFGDEPKLQSSIEAFFVRERKMRSIDVMGLTQHGEGASISFSSKEIF